MANKTLDLILIYQFIKRLTTPFDKTEAFELGLIDKNGKLLKSAETKEEEEAYTYYDRLIFNLKRLIERVPGGKSRLGSFAAALFLIREGANVKANYTEQELVEGLYESMKELDDNSMKKLSDLVEEAPANATGAAVAGTGDDPVHWKADARKKEMKAFLKRYLEQKAKRQKIKERKDFMKRFGL